MRGRSEGFKVLCFNWLYCGSSAVKHVSCESFLVSKYNQIEQLTIISVKSVNLETRCIQHNLHWLKLPGAYTSSLLCLLVLFVLWPTLYSHLDLVSSILGEFSNKSLELEIFTLEACMTERETEKAAWSVHGFTELRTFSSPGLTEQYSSKQNKWTSASVRCLQKLWKVNLNTYDLKASFASFTSNKYQDIPLDVWSFFLLLRHARADNNR